MARRSYMAETREEAYRAWRQCGQNVELTLRECAKQGLTITKPTLYDWKTKYNWHDRAARTEAQEQKANNAVANGAGSAILDLEKLKSRYETYFDTLGAGAVDNQAMFAYTGIIKSITDLQQKTGAARAAFFLDFMRDLIDWLAKNDPESVGAIERNFDEFVRFAKEKYGA